MVKPRTKNYRPETEQLVVEIGKLSSWYLLVRDITSVP